MRKNLCKGKESVAAAVAAMALAVPFAGVAFAGGGDEGKGDERPQSAPGQEKKAEHAAPQSSRSANGNGYGAGKREKPASPSKPAKNSKPAKPAKKSKPAKAPKTAKAGKSTICHSTGSKTNPFVTITVSDNALKAHARHHDGRDIIPAPAAGCPKGAKSPAAAKPEAAKDNAKVTICHATGSDTNPFVKITIAKAAVDAHRRHHDGEDIIPAPEGDCPASAPAAVAPSAARGAAPVAPAAPATPAAPAASLLPAPAAALVNDTAAPRGGVLGEFASGASPAADRLGDVAGAQAVGTRESGADVPGLGSLPFTGLDTWLLIAAGLGLLLAGVAGRRAATARL